jgi:hypothetical protein
MAIGLLQQQRSAEAVLSALIKEGGISRRQAYRYLRQVRTNLQPRVLPQSKAVFSVSLPRRLIQEVRNRCRQQRRPISLVVTQVLERWLAEEPSTHG